MIGALPRRLRRRSARESLKAVSTASGDRVKALLLGGERSAHMQTPCPRSRPPLRTPRVLADLRRRSSPHVAGDQRGAPAPISPVSLLRKVGLDVVLLQRSRPLSVTARIARWRSSSGCCSRRWPPAGCHIREDRETYVVKSPGISWIAAVVLLLRTPPRRHRPWSGPPQLMVFFLVRDSRPLAFAKARSYGDGVALVAPRRCWQRHLEVARCCRRGPSFPQMLGTCA